MNKQEIIEIKKILLKEVEGNGVFNLAEMVGTSKIDTWAGGVAERIASKLTSELTVREVVEWMQSNKVKSTNLHHDKGGVYYTNTVTCFESIEELTKIIRKEQS